MTNILDVLRNVLLLFSSYYLITEGSFGTKIIYNCLFLIHAAYIWAAQLFSVKYPIRQYMSISIITLSSYYIYVDCTYQVRPIYSFLIWLLTFINYYELLLGKIGSHIRFSKYVTLFMYLTICSNMVATGTFATKYVYGLITFLYTFVLFVDTTLEFIIELDTHQLFF